MLANPLICGTICEFLWRMSSDHSRLHSGSIINGRLTGICHPGISIHAGRKVIIYVPLNDNICPVKSIGLSKSFCRMESWCKSISPPPPHAETSTEGSGVTSPISEPGRKATVLAHKDLTVGTFGVHDISCGPGHNFKSST